MTPERETTTRDPSPGDPGRSDAPRAGLLRRWPPVLWLLVVVGAILVVSGANGDWDVLQVAIGIALAVVACGLALYLAAGPWAGRPRPQAGGLLIGGVLAFFFVCALAAVIFAGPGEAIAVLIVGIAAMTAASLWIAITRAKTRPGATGHRDPAAADRDDPFVGVGADDVRPLGDTPEAHDEITPHDLPTGHPGRAAAERQADALGGTTRGHREGGATPPWTDATDELVEDDERDGARIDRGRG
jgi:hypothetical protein